MSIWNDLVCRWYNICVTNISNSETRLLLRGWSRSVSIDCWVWLIVNKKLRLLMRQGSSDFITIDPFHLSRCRTMTTRVDYKILQLLQSGCRGEHADTYYMRTEIWPGWIILDAHRLSKISHSFSPFTEKEAPAPGWPLSLALFDYKTHTHTHTHMHSRTHARTHTCMHAHMHTYTQTVCV